LNEKFRIKDLGQLSFFLGLYMNQRKYALEILAYRGMLAAKPSSSPMAKNTKLLFAHSGHTHEEESYRYKETLLSYEYQTRYKSCSSFLESIYAISKSESSQSY